MDVTKHKLHPDHLELSECTVFYCSSVTSCVEDEGPTLAKTDVDLEKRGKKTHHDPR